MENNKKDLKVSIKIPATHTAAHFLSTYDYNVGFKNNYYTLSMYFSDTLSLSRFIESFKSNVRKEDLFTDPKKRLYNNIIFNKTYK